MICDILCFFAKRSLPLGCDCESPTRAAASSAWDGVYAASSGLKEKNVRQLEREIGLTDMCR